MKSNNNGQNGSNSSKSLSSAGQKSSSVKAEFIDLFDAEWDRLSPENAKPLTEVKENFSFKDTQEWIKSVNLILLPFHSFDEGNEFSIKFQRKIPTANLGILWSVLYLHHQSGTAALYEADLLILKRKIYEQKSELKDSLEINLEVELAPFVKKYKKIDDFNRLFQLNITLGAELYITKKQRQVAENKAGLNNLLGGFSRFKGVSIRFDKSIENSPKTFMRLGLSEYWLDWIEVAQRTEFNFDYLTSLQPIEMRFYELTQLLRFRDVVKLTDELKKAPFEIRYSDFVKLMPMSRLKTSDEVESQMNKLCQIHLQRGYLDNITIKTIKRKGIFADANLQIFFKNKII